MRRGVVVSGVLGLGTALVFGAAALASALFPNGGTISTGWNRGVVWDKGGIAVPAPMPVPAVEQPVIDDGKDGAVEEDLMRAVDDEVAASER